MLRLQEKVVDFECGALDFVCTTMESQATAMHGFMTWLAENTLGQQRLSPGSDLYEGAMGSSGLELWLGYALVVMVITGAVGLAFAALTQNGQAMKRAILGTLLSIPATFGAIWVTGQALTLVDEISDGLLERLGGANGTANLLELLVPSSAWDAGTSMITGGTPNALVIVGIMLVYIIAMLLIMVALAFRNVILMLLIAFAPLAFVLLPAKGGSVWVKRWAGAVVAMVLTKPLIFGLLLLLTGTAGGIETVWSAAGLTIGLGMLVTSLMPLMAFGFFGFIASGGSSAGESIGSQGAQKISGATSQVTNVTQMAGRFGGAGRAAAVLPAVAPVAAAATVVTTGVSGLQDHAAEGGRAGAGAGAQPTWSGKGGNAAPAVPPVPPAGGVLPGKGGGAS